MSTAHTTTPDITLAIRGKAITLQPNTTFGLGFMVACFTPLVTHAGDHTITLPETKALDFAVFARRKGMTCEARLAD